MSNKTFFTLRLFIVLSDKKIYDKLNNINITYFNIFGLKSLRAYIILNVIDYIIILRK